MPTITPFLWFDSNLQEALDFYVSIFPDAKIIEVSSVGPDGPLFLATFELQGQRFMGLNGGPMFNFTEAISMFVSVETQDEVDHYWYRLSEGGSESQCGWVKDRFGLSWQIVPTALGRLMGDPDPEKSGRVMQAMLKMSRLIIADLQAAHDA
jgi:predicted 3-demethylubiquinone-9 3-methyltransferase (glyoxalase superfamily)